MKALQRRIPKQEDKLLYNIQKTDKSFSYIPTLIEIWVAIQSFIT